MMHRISDELEVGLRVGPLLASKLTSYSTLHFRRL